MDIGKLSVLFSFPLSSKYIDQSVACEKHHDLFFAPLFLESLDFVKEKYFNFK